MFINKGHLRLQRIDDVMAVYSGHKGWRHDGLQGSHEDSKERFFLSVEDWHEQVQINLGPNVGDITTGHKLARSSRINFLKIRSPWRRKNDGALWRPKAQRRVKACRCKPTLLCNLHCKIGSIETELDTFMIRLRDYKPAGVNLCI